MKFDSVVSSIKSLKNNKIAHVAGAGIGFLGLVMVISMFSSESHVDSTLSDMTKCSSLELSNVMIGDVDDYTFQQGLSKETRSGFVNRRSGSASNGCILPTLKPQEYAYFEASSEGFDKMGSANDWSMQCVRSANPGAGAVNEAEPKGEYPYRVNFLSGKDMMLHCGNSEGIDECAEGSNSSRSTKWANKLEERGKTMFSVLAVKSTLAPEGGENLFCQYYNKKTSESLFAFEYLRVKS